MAAVIEDESMNVDEIGNQNLFEVWLMTISVVIPGETATKQFSLVATGQAESILADTTPLAKAGS